MTGSIMNWTFLHLGVLLAAIVCVFGLLPSKYDAPPVFLQPARLDDPKSLVIIGNVSDQFNTLVCAVSNADFVEWVYMKTLNGPQVKLPEQINQEDALQDKKTRNIYRTITDQFAKKKGRYNLNGYYKCVAENERGYGYKIETPPIKLIIPDLYYDSVDILSAQPVQGQLTRPYRMKCLDSEVRMRPDDLLDWNMITFVWNIKPKHTPDSTSVNLPKQISTDDGRLAVDPRTGDLFFAYLEAADGLGSKESESEYQCKMSVGDMPGDVIGSRHKLTVITDASKPSIHLVYPASEEEKRVTCLEGYRCTLTCIYGGRNWATNNNPPTPTWIQPGGKNDVAVSLVGNSVIFTAFEEAEGRWTCQTNVPEAGEDHINVVVKVFPRIPADEMEDQFVEVGTDLEFACNAEPADDITLYVNGVAVNGENSLQSVKIEDAQRENSGTVSCIAKNDAGIKFKSAQLNVYNKPNITITPENGHLIAKNYTKDELEFQCKAVLDPKVIRATVHWQSSHSELKDIALTKKHPIGIKIIRHMFDEQNHTISSTLKFDLDSTTVKTLVGGEWWCVVNMAFADRKEVIQAASKKVPYDVATKNPADEVIVIAGFDSWWLIGVIVAIFFIVIIIVLIVCCYKYRKGEQYYVDEKERKAGHNPEEEMGLYGFSDYKRPATGGYTPMYVSNQEPIKGSRTSLDRSERPLDSDSEGMDEYGDIDPGRFNEDGSFIGQYGKSSTNMEV